MGKEIFREKSLKRVNSPESLNDYVRVSNPGVWLLLGAVIVLLIGLFVWGYFGRMESKLNIRVLSLEEGVVGFVEDTDVQNVEPGMTVRIETSDGTVEGELVEIGTERLKYSEIAEEYSMHLVDSEVNASVYAILIDVDFLAEGKYSASVITESIQPLSFLFN